jgi:hypothetical protein
MVTGATVAGSMEVTGTLEVTGAEYEEGAAEGDSEGDSERNIGLEVGNVIKIRSANEIPGSKATNENKRRIGGRSDAIMVDNRKG